MKNIILSFDDARWDTYARAFPIMKQHHITGTINVISDFISNPGKYHLSCCAKGSMTREQLLEVRANGIEIAGHGFSHKNTPEDIRMGINGLKELGFDISNVGFASPESVLTSDNIDNIRSIIEDGSLKYVRSGIQIRREGLIYSALSMLNKYLHSPFLFWRLNRRSIIVNGKLPEILPSVAVYSYTTLDELKGIAKHLKDGETAIFMLHSVLEKGDPGYGCGIWYWDKALFEKLVEYLSCAHDIRTMTTLDLVLSRKFI